MVAAGSQPTGGPRSRLLPLLCGHTWQGRGRAGAGNCLGGRGGDCKGRSRDSEVGVKEGWVRVGGLGRCGPDKASQDKSLSSFSYHAKTSLSSYIAHPVTLFTEAVNNKPLLHG